MLRKVEQGMKQRAVKIKAKLEFPMEGNMEPFTFIKQPRD